MRGALVKFIPGFDVNGRGDGAGKGQGQGQEFGIGEQHCALSKELIVTGRKWRISGDGILG